MSNSLIRCARLLTAYLLTVAAIAGLSAERTVARVHDRAVRGVRIGQRLEFGQGCPTRFNDHRHVSPDELRPNDTAIVMSTDADRGIGDTGQEHAVSAVLAALALRHDALVKRLSPPGGPHTPRLASFAPLTGRAPPFFS